MRAFLMVIPKSIFYPPEKQVPDQPTSGTGGFRDARPPIMQASFLSGTLGYNRYFAVIFFKSLSGCG